MTAINTETIIKICRHCYTDIHLSDPGCIWVDMELRETCKGRSQRHEPTVVLVSAPKARCRVVDQIIRWTDTDGNLNAHKGDLILDQGEMCLIEDIHVEVLDDGSLWLHVSLRDPRRTETGLPVAAREFSGSGLVAVRRYLTEETQ